MLRQSGSELPRRLERLLYGRGLCLGMVVTALVGYERDGGDLAGLHPDAGMRDIIRKYHVRQYRLRAVTVTGWNWLRARGGQPGYALKHLRLPDESPDPHILCFGPTLNRRFLRCLARAHAVAPYRVEDRDGEHRVYIYDPNYPKDRERYVTFRRVAGGRSTRFSYGEFDSRTGCGITLLPLSAVASIRPAGMR